MIEIAEYKNGSSRTYENNDMSLSCHAYIKIKNEVIKDIYYKGIPRTEGRDSWLAIYKSFKIGQKISNEMIEKLLCYNGRNNIVSVFEEVEE